MMTFDEVYEFLSNASASRWDASLSTPQTRTIIKHALPYLKILGISVDEIGRDRVRGVKSTTYEIKIKGKPIFKHNSVLNHSGQLAANLLQCFVDDGDPKFIRKDNWR
tara:strand:- start:506 stop:829 length:324 start_codon:yes stop_codon:yes gene_type:complete